MNRFNNSAPQPTVALTANTSWYLFNFRSNLIRILVEKGYRVLAIAPRDDYSKKLEVLGCDFHPLKLDAGGTNPIADTISIFSFFRLYRKFKPDVILNFTPKNNIYSTLAASPLTIPCINNVAGMGQAFINEGLVARIARMLYRASQKRAAHVFFQNEEDRELFVQESFIEREKTERIPGSGVDLERFVSLPLPPGKVRFLLMGRLLYAKGVEEFVMASKALKEKYTNVECLLMGFIAPRKPTAIPEEVVRHWHDEGYITYLGNSDHVEKEIAKAHCLVLPSYYREGVPRSLLEGAAMGRPIITTDQNGCRETIKSGVSGLLCKTRNFNDLFDKMESIVTMSPEERQAMGNASRIHVEQYFNEDIVTNHYLARIKTYVNELTTPIPD